MGITRESRTEMVREIIKLSIFYAFRQSPDGRSFADVLTRQTPVYRLLGRWDGTHHPATGAPDPQWTAWVTELARLPPGPPSEDFGVNVFRSEWEAGVERDLRLWPWTPDTYGRTPLGTGTYGFFLYELRSSPGEPDVLFLHMGNALAPESPFADPPARFRELRAVLTDARQRCPGLTRVACESWLNSHPGFLQFFPPAWKNSARPMPMGYYFSWWGQFVTRAGGFHFRNGEHLRRTGAFPFPSSGCHCTLADFEAHLQCRMQ